jgi:magnesium chelatase family protein
VTVNLSPAHLRKTGSGFDLAMALGVLVAAGRVAQDRLRDLCLLGELSLDGTVRAIRGVLPSVIAAASAGVRSVMVPAPNAREAGLVRDVDVFPVEHLGQVVRFLRGECIVDPWVRSLDDGTYGIAGPEEDLADVRGNAAAKRALEITAAGGHNILLMGPPGGGKSMLARRVPGILPPMSEAEAFEVTRIYSVAGLLPRDRPLITRRPFRAPHHSSSTVGLVGGGAGIPHPGEMSLATRGVLFLDEFGEFRREALQALRQPMEDGTVTLVRSQWSVTYPARFQLVVASNPCPCGYIGDSIRPCVCAPGRLTAYRERLTGPVVDRIDLQVEIPRLTRNQLFGPPEGDSSVTVVARVVAAREAQRARLKTAGRTCNAEIPARDIERICAVRPAARSLVEQAVERLGLSARGAHRVLRVSRTIADLAGSECVETEAVEEALGYRVLDGRH